MNVLTCLIMLAVLGVALMFASHFLLMLFKPNYKSGPLSQFETVAKDEIPYEVDELPEHETDCEPMPSPSKA